MKIINSFKYALQGMKSVIISERNMRIHLLLFLMATGLGFFLKISGVEWSLLVLTAAMVLIAETVNTAIEKACNFVEPNKHPDIKQIKDISASAVLLAAIAAVVMACILFLPKIITYVL